MLSDNGINFKKIFTIQSSFECRKAAWLYCVHQILILEAVLSVVYLKHVNVMQLDQNMTRPNSKGLY